MPETPAAISSFVMGVLEAVDTAHAAHKGPRPPVQGRPNGSHLSRHGREDVWLHDAHGSLTPMFPMTLFFYVHYDPLLLPDLSKALKKKMVKARGSES